MDRPAKNEILTRGKEHLVALKETRVSKYQDGPALVPIPKGGKVAVREALPIEYLERLDLQNEFFGDDLRVEGVLKSGKLVTSQTLVKGSQPTGKEMTGMLKDLGWVRIPANLHDLPHNLMATAWMHPGEEIVLVDARIPNLKRHRAAMCWQLI
ncbi:MAG: hypothetical protein P1V20_05325 [Verrucomicrobiales bacterium]|nr:hypothetical protein [Verrucomicrobiales bacterium]